MTKRLLVEDPQITVEKLADLNCCYLWGGASAKQKELITWLWLLCGAPLSRVIMDQRVPLKDATWLVTRIKPRAMLSWARWCLGHSYRLYARRIAKDKWDPHDDAVRAWVKDGIRFANRLSRTGDDTVHTVASSCNAPVTLEHAKHPDILRRIFYAEESFNSVIRLSSCYPHLWSSAPDSPSNKVEREDFLNYHTGRFTEFVQGIHHSISSSHHHDCRLQLHRCVLRRTKWPRRRKK